MQTWVRHVHVDLWICSLSDLYPLNPKLSDHVPSTADQFINNPQIVLMAGSGEEWKELDWQQWNGRNGTWTAAEWKEWKERDWSDWHDHKDSTTEQRAKVGSQEEAKNEEEEEEETDEGDQEAESKEQDWSENKDKKEQETENKHQHKITEDKWVWVHKERLWVHIYLHNRHEEFDIVPMLIGREGKHMKSIWQDGKAKARVRGRGSGHAEQDGLEAPVPLMLAISTHKTQQKFFLEAVRLAEEILKEIDKQYAWFCSQRGLPPPQANEHSFSFGEVPPVAEELLKQYSEQYPPPPFIMKKAAPGGVAVKAANWPKKDDEASSSKDAAPEAPQEPVKKPKLVFPPSHAPRRCSRTVGDQTPVWPVLQQQIREEEMMVHMAHQVHHWQQMKAWQMAASWQQQHSEMWNVACSWHGWDPQAGYKLQQGNVLQPGGDEEYWNFRHQNQSEDHYPWGVPEETTQPGEVGRPSSNWAMDTVEPSKTEVPAAVSAAWGVPKETTQPGEVDRPISIWAMDTVAQPPADAEACQQDTDRGEFIEIAVNHFLNFEDRACCEDHADEAVVPFSI